MQPSAWAGFAPKLTGTLTVDGTKLYAWILRPALMGDLTAQLEALQMPSVRCNCNWPPCACHRRNSWCCVKICRGFRATETIGADSDDVSAKALERILPVCVRAIELDDTIVQVLANAIVSLRDALERFFVCPAATEAFGASCDDVSVEELACALPD